MFEKSGLHNCTNCGFLCVFLPYDIPNINKAPLATPAEAVMWWQFWGRNQEFTIIQREILCKGGPFNRKSLICVRNIWLPDNTEISKMNDEEFRAFLTKPRKCNYLFPHSPGLNPEHHFNLMRERNTNRLLWKVSVISTLIGAFIGAGAAIIAVYLD